MTTLNDLYWNTRSLALGGLREEYNTLSNNLSDLTQGSADTVTISGTLGSMQASVVIEIDYEQMLIMGVSGQNLSVIRGWNNSTTSAHSSGAVVTVEPEFSAYDIILAINQELDDLSSPENGLYQTLECTVTYNPVLVGYDLTDVNTNEPVTNIIEVLEVRDHEYGPYQQWPLVPLTKVKLQRNADTTIFPSGLALERYIGGYPGQPTRIQYKAPYNSILANSTDDVLGVTGLHTQAHDIPPLGAMLRIMETKEFKRTFMDSQGEPRRSSEVPVGSSLTATKGIAQKRMDRIAAERTRLELQTKRQFR